MLALVCWEKNYHSTTRLDMLNRVGKCTVVFNRVNMHSKKIKSSCVYSGVTSSFVVDLQSFSLPSSKFISGKGLFLVSGNNNERKPAVTDAEPNTIYGKTVGVPS